MITAGTLSSRDLQILLKREFSFIDILILHSGCCAIQKKKNCSQICNGYLWPLGFHYLSKVLFTVLQKNFSLRFQSNIFKSLSYLMPRIYVLWMCILLIILLIFFIHWLSHFMAILCLQIIYQLFWNKYVCPHLLIYIFSTLPIQWLI